MTEGTLSRPNPPQTRGLLPRLDARLFLLVCFFDHCFHRPCWIILGWSIQVGVLEVRLIRPGKACAGPNRPGKLALVCTNTVSYHVERKFFSPTNSLVSFRANSSLGILRLKLFRARCYGDLDYGRWRRAPIFYIEPTARTDTFIPHRTRPDRPSQKHGKLADGMYVSSSLASCLSIEVRKTSIMLLFEEKCWRRLYTSILHS